MKKKIRFVSLVILLAISFNLVSCSSSKTPTKSVENYFKSEKNYGRLFDEIFSEDRESEFFSKSQRKRILKEIKNSNYNINLEEIDKETAIVNITFKALDLQTVFENYYTEFLMFAFQAISNNEDSESKDDLSINPEKIMDKEIDNIRYVEKTENISLELVEGSWKVKEDINLIKLLFNLNEDTFNGL